MTTAIDDIRANFELLEDWDDRYRYVIELGRTLAQPLTLLAVECSFSGIGASVRPSSIT